MSKNETNAEKIKQLFADYAAHQKRLDEAGDPDAHLKWAFAEAFLDTLKAGYRITDFSCFRHHPLYTGAQRNAPPDEVRSQRIAGEIAAELNIETGTEDLITPELIAEELKNISMAAPG